MYFLVSLSISTYMYFCKFLVALHLQVVYGVKGKSVLQIIPSFDVVKSVPVDYMHCVLLGLVRKLLSLWFDRQSGNSKNEWFVLYTLHGV